MTGLLWFLTSLVSFGLVTWIPSIYVGTFGDGTFLPADVIVCATGYRPMSEWVGQLISPEVERKVGPCWGAAQEGLWFQGGNIMQSRFHSLHVALQLKARMEGVPTPVYRHPQ